MEAAAIHVKKQKGALVVQAIGRTNRGTKFLKGQVPIKAKRIRDKSFKGEMAAALEELLGSEA